MRDSWKMNILILHQNFPGQFRSIAQHLLTVKGVNIKAIAHKKCPGLENVETIKYELHRSIAKETHHYIRPLESGVLYGQAVARLLLKLKQDRFYPHIVLAHPGWGEALYVKDVFPNAKLISFFEFFYQSKGADVGFDPSLKVSFDDMARVRTKNALNLLNLDACDVGISPTNWQKSLHPAAYHSKIRVIHEGVDVELLKPATAASFRLPNGAVLHHHDEVVTYVARNLEPYRGFPTLMKTIELVSRQKPNCQFVIVGGDEVSYGGAPKDASCWREKMVREVELDLSRVHFLGRIPYDQYRLLLQISTVHVYLTYPFVLSWSMLEAMASGCLVIGSATAPVQEVITEGFNGLLVDFFHHEDLAKRICDVLNHRDGFDEIKRRARETIVNGYSHKKGLIEYMRLFDQVLG